MFCFESKIFCRGIEFERRFDRQRCKGENERRKREMARYPSEEGIREIRCLVAVHGARRCLVRTAGGVVSVSIWLNWWLQRSPRDLVAVFSKSGAEDHASDG